MRTQSTQSAVAVCRSSLTAVRLFASIVPGPRHRQCTSSRDWDARSRAATVPGRALLFPRPISPCAHSRHPCLRLVSGQRCRSPSALRAPREPPTSQLRLPWQRCIRQAGPGPRDSTPACLRRRGQGARPRPPRPRWPRCFWAAGPWPRRATCGGPTGSRRAKRSRYQHGRVRRQPRRWRHWLSADVDAERTRRGRHHPDGLPAGAVSCHAEDG